MEPTREIFGNIPGSSQVLFYALTVVSLAVFGYGVWRRFRLWHQGQPIQVRALFTGRLREILAQIGPGGKRLLVDGLGQRRVAGRGWAGRAHIAMFAGFMVLLLGTTLLEIDHLAEMISKDLKFHQGTYYVIYEFTLDVFGLIFLLGCGYFLWRRTRLPASIGHRATDWYVLGSFIAIGVTGYLVEALRLIWQHPTGIGAECSPVGLWLAGHLFSGLTETAARAAHFGLWWLHAVMVLGFIAAIPFTRLFHFIAGPINLFLAKPSLGSVSLVTMEEVERTGRIGVGAIADFTRQQLLSLDACMECGRCEEACPPFATGKPLSPKQVVQDLKRLMEETGFAPSGTAVRGLHGDTIRAETLWACTACSACVDVCPVRIDQVTLILDLRRYLVAEGGLSGPAATALRRMQSAGNPWGLPASERAVWRETLNS